MKSPARIMRFLLLSVVALPIKVAMFFVGLAANWLTFLIGGSAFYGVLNLSRDYIGTENAFCLAAVSGYCSWHSACQFFDWLQTRAISPLTQLRNRNRPLVDNR